MTRAASHSKPSVAACVGVVVLVFYAFNHTSFATAADRCDLASYSKKVTELDLKNCGLTALPESIARFVALTKLDVSHNPLDTLPPLPASLEVLFCMGGNFEAVPASVGLLPSLRMLSFKSCKLRALGPTALPASLAWLILTDNALGSLPDDFGTQVPRVRKLMLSNNRLESLPASMASMAELELLRLASNRLAAVPKWLLELPMLTWLALAGNPCGNAAPPRASLPTISPTEIELGETLGEGTSGVVRRGTWRGQAVAVKEYRQRLSSDGQNIDEVRASCAVEHAHVLKFLGYYSEGGSGGAGAGAGWRLGAVLEWAPGFLALGKPPSLSTITRDTYPAGVTFSGSAIRRVGYQLAAALEHVHATGLSHGDVYAHNVLYSKAVPGGAVAKLADFGAAFYYGPHSRDAHRYERMEQRAFGLLLEEMLERHDGSSAGQLLNVRVAARQATGPHSGRPGFAALRSVLEPHTAEGRRGSERSKVVGRRPRAAEDARAAEGRQVELRD